MKCNVKVTDDWEVAQIGQIWVSVLKRSTKGAIQHLSYSTLYITLHQQKYAEMKCLSKLFQVLAKCMSKTLSK